MTSSDKLTRFSRTLYEDADRVAGSQHRSTRQQLEHWASLGRSLSAHTSTMARVQRAMAGEIPTEALSSEESAVLDTLVDQGVEDGLAATDLSLPEHQTPRPVGTLVNSEHGIALALGDGTKVFAPDPSQE